MAPAVMDAALKQGSKLVALHTFIIYYDIFFILSDYKCKFY